MSKKEDKSELPEKRKAEEYLLLVIIVLIDQ